MKISKGLFTLLLAMATVACSSKGTVVENYPNREIDRPYTLPDGMKSWGIVGGTFTGLSDPDDDSDGGFLNPLYWETPIEDNFSVVWWPLPLGLKWQIYKDERNRWGLSFLTALIFSAGEITYRRHLADDHAVELGFERESFNFIFLDYDLTIYRASYLWQFNDLQYLSLGAGAGKLEAGSEFIEALIDGLTGLDTSLDYEQDVFLYDIGWGYRFSKQWNLDLRFQRFNLGGGDVDSADDASYGNFTLSLLHYWD